MIKFNRLKRTFANDREIMQLITTSALWEKTFNQQWRILEALNGKMTSRKTGHPRCFSCSPNFACQSLIYIYKYKNYIKKAQYSFGCCLTYALDKRVPCSLDSLQRNPAPVYSLSLTAPPSTLRRGATTQRWQSATSRVTNTRVKQVCILRAPLMYEFWEYWNVYISVIRSSRDWLTKWYSNIISSTKSYKFFIKYRRKLTMLPLTQFPWIHISFAKKQFLAISASKCLVWVAFVMCTLLPMPQARWFQCRGQLCERLQMRSKLPGRNMGAQRITARWPPLHCYSAQGLCCKINSFGGDFVRGAHGQPPSLLFCPFVTRNSPCPKYRVLLVLTHFMHIYTILGTQTRKFNFWNVVDTVNAVGAGFWCTNCGAWMAKECKCALWKVLE